MPSQRSRVPWWRRQVRALVRLNDSPPRIAGGVAIGVAIGVAPTFGAGAILAAGLAALLRCNPAAAVVGSVAGLPPFIFGVWIVSAWLGASIFGMEFAALHETFRSGRALRAGGEVLAAYLAGNAVVTLLLTAVSYGAVLRLLRRTRRV